MSTVKVYSPVISERTQVDVVHSTFPAGEQYVRLHIPTEAHEYKVVLLAADSWAITQALLIADAIKNVNPRNVVIAVLDYVPYGRQDRVCSPGESFSLKLLAEMISLRFDYVETYDTHSKVTDDMLGIKLIKKYPNLQDMYVSADYYTIEKDGKGVPGVAGVSKLYGSVYMDSIVVSPDKGALDRAQALSDVLYNASSQTFDFDVVEFKKTRVDMNTIVSEPARVYTKYSTSQIPEDVIRSLSTAKHIIVPDDICDGGGTFIALAKAIREYNEKATLTLVISHGVFSQGFNTLLEYYERVLVTKDSYNRGRLIQIFPE